MSHATKRTTHRERIDSLLSEAGTTYAEQAGIQLADEPGPLWRLLVFSDLVSARIQSGIAVTGSRALFAAGGGTAEGMATLTWRQRKDALLDGRYHHLANGTATRLGATAELAQSRYGGDLRRLADEADERPGRVAELLQEFPGIGPAGAAAFCRDAQAVWPFLRPALDDRVLAGAARLGLPADPRALADLVPADRLAALADALVRVKLDDDLAARVRGDGHSAT
ncbi:endonuclease [Actinomadura decatromicini]|uniref:Endonuclease n=1 Tax=Actinomadura decatromicini TaxID=2604572 RepID=A0A5D3FFM2_9ACTN|nr:endonuclease [Actinomadura decatromicini]TYK46095.1 endonuclease [Actinomadura decatromicini]